MRVNFQKPFIVRPHFDAATQPCSPLMSGETILVIEDDSQIAQAIHFRLQTEGFSPLIAADTMSADDLLRRHMPDLIILDVGLPHEDGFSWLERQGDVGSRPPVLMLTARSMTDDKVKGLKLGADDYLAKPFEFAELLARIGAVLRRRRRPSGTTLRIGNLRIETDLKRVLIDSTNIDFSPREYSVLTVLAEQPQRVISKSQILQRLADQDLKAADLNDSAVEVIVHRIRRKLETANIQIETVRGFGYLLK